jgi:hypothetical protein
MTAFFPGIDRSTPEKWCEDDQSFMHVRPAEREKLNG